MTHWIWYVLPQLKGLGTSSRAAFYGIGSADEARAYLAHPVLGPRLTETVAAMNALRGLSAAHILGLVYAAKFASCLTLFLSVDPGNAVFREALDKYFAGVQARGPSRFSARHERSAIEAVLSPGSFPMP